MISKSDLKKDIPASIVVFFVALPLCLGIALASGAPLFSGLIAGIVGGVVVGAVSKSPLGVSGPAAGLTVIVLGAIETLGTFEAFLLAVVLGGLMQIILGLLRAGVLGYFFPAAVIQGMLTGIGIIIILKQIPHALGFDDNPVGDMNYREVDGGTSFSAFTEMLDFIHPGVMLISFASLAILIAWEMPRIARHRWLGMVPGPVVAVAFAVTCQIVFAGLSMLSLSDTHLVAVPVAESFDEFRSLFVTPDFGQISNPAIWTVALTIAAVASVETLLSVEAVDRIDPQKRVTPTNRELMAQGVGNSLSGMIGGLPITQVIVRSSANVQAGGRTKASTISHGLLLAICVVTVPHWLNLIPLGVLAAVLLVTGYKLAKPVLFKKMWGYGPEQFIPFIVTVLGVVFTDLLLGVGMGMTVALVILLQWSFRNSHFLHMKTAEGDSERQVITMHLAEEVTFLNKGAIRQQLDEIPDNSILVIDQSKCVYLNHDVREILDDFIKVSAERGIEVRETEALNQISGPKWTSLRGA